VLAGVASPAQRCAGPLIHRLAARAADQRAEQTALPALLPPPRRNLNSRKKQYREGALRLVQEPVSSTWPKSYCIRKQSVNSVRPATQAHPNPPLPFLLSSPQGICFCRCLCRCCCRCLSFCHPRRGSASAFAFAFAVAVAFLAVIPEGDLLLPLSLPFLLSSPQGICFSASPPYPRQLDRRHGQESFVGARLQPCRNTGQEAVGFSP
jgi:hypothetical protein